MSVLIWLSCFIKNRSHLSHTIWPPWNFSLSSSLPIQLFKTIHMAVSSFWNKSPYIWGLLYTPHLSSYRANQEFSSTWDTVMPNFLQWISNSCICFVHRTGNIFLIYFESQYIKAKCMAHDFLACPNYKVKWLHLSYCDSDCSASCPDYKMGFYTQFAVGEIKT